ncbi:MAG: NUDIX domain-containing protein [Gammaproteobacteria bacterium]|nr:NUDIX domain-containing protein [Gammaproteobacteria bacterium]NNJ96947.1 NUDIX domain-containing protein [Gammaproteobacteria bacterium]
MIENLVPGIRNAVRAVITKDDLVLLQLKVDDNGAERYALPGGAQEHGERLIDALQRECEEEIGTRIEVIDLMFVGDYFKPRQTNPPTTRHLLEFLFACTVTPDYEPRNGPRPDKHQVDVLWVPINDLAGLNLVPADYVNLLIKQYEPRVYVGQLF